jgi:CubicO group peptidase (beta-lactamase class C family)
MKYLTAILLFGISLGYQNLTAAQDKRDKNFPVPNTIDPGTPHKVGQFTNLATISPSCKVSKSDAPVQFKKNLKNLSSLKIDNFTIGDYIAKHNVMGFTVIRDGIVVDQQYRFERRETDLFTSMSVSKSVVSILIGIAHTDGLISSLDDPVKKYTGKLDNTPYANVSIRSLLRMSSGVTFEEIYPVKPKTDGYDFFVEAMFVKKPSVISAINKVKKRSTGEGTTFNYASVETAVLAEVIRGAANQSLCQYMQEKLWKNIGAEHDAFWNVDSDGIEFGYGWLNASQADYAKLAILLINGGNLNGKRILSSDFVDEATNIEKQPQQFRRVIDKNEPAKSAGYGYKFWLTETPGRYFMQGIFGQYVLIDNKSKTVLLINSADSAHLSDARTKNTLRIFDKLTEQEF